MESELVRVYRALREPFPYESYPVRFSQSDNMAHPCARECFRMAKILVECNAVSALTDVVNARISLVRFGYYTPARWLGYRD